MLSLVHFVVVETILRHHRQQLVQEQEVRHHLSRSPQLQLLVLLPLLLPLRKLLLHHAPLVQLRRLVQLVHTPSTRKPSWQPSCLLAAVMAEELEQLVLVENTPHLREPPA